MSDFSFLALPNIQGMRLWWYIQIVVFGIFFGICLFFVLYFLLMYRKNRILSHHLDDFDQQAHNLAHHMLRHKIEKTSGKKKLILFIEYLEKFITNTSYANIWELLCSQWFTLQEVEECEHVLYADKELSKQIDHRINNYFTS